MNLFQKGLVLVLVPQICSLVFALVLLQLLDQAEKAAARESVARAIAYETDLIAKMFFDGSSAVIIYGVTHDKRLVNTFRSTTQMLPQHLRTIENLVQGEPRQLAAFRELAAGARRGICLTNELADLALKDGRILFKAHGKDIGRQLELCVADMVNGGEKIKFAETRLQGIGLKRSVHARQTARDVIIGAIAVNILVTAMLAVFYSKSITGRLRVLSDNSQRLSKQLPLVPELGGKDEIAALDHVFHQMAQDLIVAIQREKAVVDNVLDVICSLDDEGKFCNVSPAANQVWGYAPTDLVGASCLDFLSAADGRALLAGIAGRSSGSFETNFKRKDGTLIDCLWSAQWSPGENLLYCVVHDVSEAKRVERLKQEFVQMITHDMRTPLGSIQMTLYFLAQGRIGQLSDDERQRVGQVEDESGRLLSLINELLDMEKLQSGGLELQKATISLAAVVAKSLAAVSAVAEKRQLELVCQLEDLSVQADESRLIQVFVNLLGNAVKYAPQGSKIIVASSCDESTVTVTIDDQGPGVPDSEHEEIFDRFHQIASPQHQRQGGTGLGLTICKAIIEGHGGKIGVKASPSGGARFWFLLPRQAQVVTGGIAGEDGEVAGS